MSTSLAQLRTQYYSILNVSPGNNFPITIANEQINRAENTILTSNPKDMKTGDSVQKPKLPFLDNYVFLSNAQDTYLSLDALITDVTLSVSSTQYFKTSGSLWINGDIVSYTGLSPTLFTGCSQLGFAWPTGTRIAQLYPIPTDSAQILELRIPKMNLAVEFRNYDNLLKQNRDSYGQSRTRQYNILDSWSNQDRALHPYYTIISAKYILLVAYNE